MEYFFDSGAIIDLIEGAENYLRFKNLPIITTTLNISEVYFYFLKEHDEQTADYWIRKLNFKLVNIIKFDAAIKAARLRFKNKKENLSYADCIGYITAKEMGVKFLTGDEKFKNKENVEFVE
ncbi:PIN domain-containing protein [Candidatus Pacearchaeota archaeon]|nr:PIN domain-containing protein [Candidatus Pacearchaeota archaeon]